jgi:aminoglycoside 3-N-acetyltransferase
MIHASFNYFNGFKGNPQDIITSIMEIIGEQGNIVMVSLPYTTSSLEYLNTKPVFDVRKTMSKMGIISEIFRRRKDVLRSLHPTHPVLVWGKDSSWMVENHHKCLYPCGEGSPFDKFRTLNGKVLFFDVPFNTFTFIHYIEDLIKNDLEFPLYIESPVYTNIIDYFGNKITMPILVFSEKTVKLRNPNILKKELEKSKLIKKKNIYKTKLMLVKAEDVIQCTFEMLEKGLYFYNNV